MNERDRGREIGKEGEIKRVREGESERGKETERERRRERAKKGMT